MIDCERESERIRQKLLRNPYFDIQRAFKVIDVRNKGGLNEQDLDAALKKEGYKDVNALQIQLIYKRFKGTSNG